MQCDCSGVFESIHCMNAFIRNLSIISMYIEVLTQHFTFTMLWICCVHSTCYMSTLIVEVLLQSFKNHRNHWYSVYLPCVTMLADTNLCYLVNTEACVNYLPRVTA